MTRRRTERMTSALLCNCVDGYTCRACRAYLAITAMRYPGGEAWLPTLYPDAAAFAKALLDGPPPEPTPPMTQGPWHTFDEHGNPVPLNKRAAKE